MLDRTGAPDGAVLFGAVLPDLVLPVTVLFGILETRAIGTPTEEIV